jgi:hypothetical protein
MSAIDLPVTVCEAMAVCQYPSVVDAQIDGHRYLQLRGDLGPQTVTLPDTVIEAADATVGAQLGLSALLIQTGADRVQVHDLTVYRRTEGTFDLALVEVRAYDAVLTRLGAEDQASSDLVTMADLVLVNFGSATLEEPTLVGNRGAGLAPVVALGGELVVRGGQIVGNGGTASSAVYASDSVVTLEAVQLVPQSSSGDPTAGPQAVVRVDATHLQMIDIDQTWSGDQLAVTAFLGSVGIVRGVWASDAQVASNVPMVLAHSLDQLDIVGTRFTTAARRPLVAAEVVGQLNLTGAVFEGPSGPAVFGGQIDRLAVTDGWFCGSGGPLAQIEMVDSCTDGPCTVTGTVFSGSGPGGAVAVEGDLAVARSTVVDAGENTSINARGHLALDRVLLDGAGALPVAAATLEVSSSAFSDTSGLGQADAEQVYEVTPRWRGVATGACGLDVQLADVPEHAWLAERAVGAFPLCWQDGDGDGAGDPLALLTADESYEGCPAGWEPVEGDCDDSDPSVQADCPVPSPAPDPGLYRLASGSCATAAGAGPTGAAMAALALLWRAVRRRWRAPRLPGAARFG